jgi:hypothetical protein
MKSQTLPITRVTVHRDGALVERRGDLPVEDGRIAVSQLPLLLNERSLRVEVLGAALTRVEMALDVAGLDRTEEIAAVTALKEAERNLAKLTLRRDLLTRQREALEHVVPADPDEENERIPDPDALAAWVDLQGALGAWATDLDDQLHPLHREIEEAEEERRRRVRALERVSSEGFWRRWAPTRRLVLHVQGEGTATVSISYRVDGATWTPAYALHADGGFRGGRLVVRALVAQATGEDWKGVTLSLSTAPCRRTVTVPKLRAIRLGSAQPPQPSAWRELPPDLESLFPEGLAGRREEPRKPIGRGAAPPSPKGKPKKAKKKAGARRRAAELQRFAAEVDEEEETGAAPAPQMAVRGGAPAPEAAPAAEASRFEVPTDGLFAGAISAQAHALSEPEGRLTVRNRALDYPRLRLAGWDAPPGVRGRLQQGSLADLAKEAGVPEAGVSQLVRHQEEQQARAKRVGKQPLPPHHVLPAPLDGADFRWDAQDTVDIVSDGHFHSVGVFTRPLEMSIGYRVVPQMDARAFRSVTARLAEAVPLLPGPVDVFVGGALEITTPWKGSARGATLELGLGPEDRIRVARNVRYREESGGLFRGGRRLHTEVEVRFASSLSRAAELEVLERMPVPGEDSVEVALASSKPTAKEWKGDPDGAILRGGLRQVVTLSPGGEATTTIHYTITLSARDEITGGDRRG